MAAPSETSHYPLSQANKMKMNVHFKYKILCLAASIALAACQDTDMPQSQPENDRAEETVATYLRVNLHNIGNATGRAAGGSYQSGSTDESTVHWADFYFYDDKGNSFAVTTGNSNCIRLSNLNKSDETTTKGANVEATYGLLTLWLKENDPIPARMTVVVNSDTKYNGKNLSEMAEVNIYPFTTVNGKTAAVMTAASFFDNDNDTENNNDDYPFTVRLTDANLFKDLTDANKSPVSVYVERLWAKVTLKLAENSNLEWVDEAKQIIIKVSTRSSITDEKEKTAFVQLHAWGLNATEKTSLLMKSIDKEWSFTWEAKNNSWNHPGYYRSYWGKSLHYKYDYVDYANSAMDESIDDKALTYRSLKDYNDQSTKGLYNAGSTLGSPQYAMEHTPSVDHLKVMYKSAGSACVTSAILIAQLLGFDENGDGQLSDNELLNADKILYRMDGAFWNEEDLKRSLYSLFATNIWVVKKETSESTIYERISEDCFQLVNIGDGLVGLGITDYSKLPSSLFYKDDQGEMQSYTTLDVDLRTFNKNKASSLHINGFTDGWMYYNIAIEHLAPFTNGIKYNDANYEGNNIQEGQYGVLRNHWYEITVNSITDLGWGIMNPEEPIVPQLRTDKAAVSFKVKVCPWHVYEYDFPLDSTDDTPTGTDTEVKDNNEQ